MNDSTSDPTEDVNTATNRPIERVLCVGAMQRQDVIGESEFDPVYSNKDTNGTASGRANIVERLSRYGARALLGSASARRSRLLKEAGDTGSAPSRLSAGVPERGSITPALRKKYLKDLFLSNPSHSGLNHVLSSESSGVSRDSEEDVRLLDYTSWALSPMEHAWMLSSVDPNYETIMDFLSEDPYLLTRKDVVSGYTVLHWLAKGGQDETLIKLLKHSERVEIPVNINVKGSGGLTPLHVAAMHSQYMVIKILVGAFGANVDAMDYNGRKAWQYLKEITPIEIKELLGTWDEEHIVFLQNTNNNCANQLPTAEISEEKDEVDSFDLTRRSVSRFGSFKKLLSPFSFFGKKM
ncbi:ankyrin repeat domain-containing protein SOWAHD [Osmerus eperlanus]|uniref:ankyrin repeat domain-containing protein SOWAHD n=1 Tax=Osmerus eperlanus TaxID=29151 RepID=UPI002E13D96D